MNEIRIDGRKHREYEGYSKSVQEYHMYDIYEEDLSDIQTVSGRYVAEANMKQLIILSGMNESEYQELQDSLTNHVQQKKIRLAEQRLELAELAKESSDGKIYPFCVELLKEDVSYPLAVFKISELKQAKEYADQVFERNIDNHFTVQLSEGLFGKDGNALGNNRLIFVSEEWKCD